MNIKQANIGTPAVISIDGDNITLSGWQLSTVSGLTVLGFVRLALKHIETRASDDDDGGKCLICIGGKLEMEP